MIPLPLRPDRLFSSEPAPWDLSRALAVTIRRIVGPHGRTDNEPFTDASALFITPDHCVFRMLYSQGVKLEDLSKRAYKLWRSACAQSAQSGTMPTCPTVPGHGAAFRAAAADSETNKARRRTRMVAVTARWPPGRLTRRLGTSYSPPAMAAAPCAASARSGHCSTGMT